MYPDVDILDWCMPTILQPLVDASYQFQMQSYGKYDLSRLNSKKYEYIYHPPYYLNAQNTVASGKAIVPR